MNIRRSIAVSPFLPFFLPALLAAGCAAEAQPTLSPDDALDGEGIGVSEAPLVRSDAPIRGPNVEAPMPALRDVPFGMRVNDPRDRTGRDAAHEARYSNGRDLAAVPVTLDDAWLARLAGDSTTSAAGFSGTPTSMMNRAVTAARSEIMGGYSAIDTLLEGLSRVTSGIGVEASYEPFAERSYAFTPARARWLKSEWVAPESCTSSLFCSDTRHTYADPAHLDEFRQRGARLYCASTEVFRRARTTGHRGLMGRKAAGTMRVFGRAVDFMRFEPTAVLGSPDKFASSVGDGAQAFSIPMQVGTRLTPVSLLGSLPEIRVPVTMITGDSEVENASDPGRITTISFQRVGTTWLPVTRSFDGHRKEWQTVTHGDAYLTAGRAIRIKSPDIPLFQVGPVGVSLGVGGSLEIGRSQVPRGKLVRGGPVGWPFAREGTWTAPNGTAFARHYHEGSWSLSRFAHGTTPVVARTLEPLPAGASFSLTPDNPFLARAFMDDDKALEIVTRAALDAALKAGAGFNFANVVRFELSVDGGVSGEAEQIHVIREQEEIGTRVLPGVEFEARSPVAQTSLSVTPATKSTLYATFGVNLYFGVRMPWGWINLGGRIVDVREPVAGDRVPQVWPERNRLRIGTSSDYPSLDPSVNVMKKPDVTSHLPLAGEFASFTRDVDTCMAAPAETGDFPPACGSTPGTMTPGDAPPRAEVCAYYPTHWNGEFGPARTPAQVACLANLQSFLRGGVSRRQSFEADYTFGTTTRRSTETVDARVLDSGDPATLRAYADIANACGAAFGSEADVRQVLYAAPCSSDATLLRDLVTWTPDDPSTPPSAPGACR
jgi:hypothetical protein